MKASRFYEVEFRIRPVYDSPPDSKDFEDYYRDKARLNWWSKDDPDDPRSKQLDIKEPFTF